MKAYKCDICRSFFEDQQPINLEASKKIIPLSLEIVTKTQTITLGYIAFGGVILGFKFKKFITKGQ